MVVSRLCLVAYITGSYLLNYFEQIMLMNVCNHTELATVRQVNSETNNLR